ncbi:DUF2723 domain-containing protein [Candidatus Sumerlaeota bacterium]|nr:DUF2723 domain-containing protein [Candidatus Sumerlaeota bacterium]
MERKRQETGLDGIFFLQRYAPFFIAIASLAIYLKTTAPTIYWGDGIELSTVCATGGIAHPTGYPLFTIVGYILCRFFPENPALGTNFLCALFGALASGFFFLALKSVLKMAPSSWFLYPHYRDVAAAACALTLAFSRTFWFHATITEVYSLHLLFVTVLLWIFFEYIQKGGTNRLLVFFGLWGLGFSNHMLTLTLSPLAAVILWKSFRDRIHWKIYPTLIALFLSGLLFYLYLPLRAAAKPELNWGNPSNLKNFIWVVSGGTFKNERFLMESPGIPFTFPRFMGFALNRLVTFATWIPEEMRHFEENTPLLKSLTFVIISVMMIAGAVRIRLFSRFAFIGLSGYVMFGLFMATTYNILDIEPYFMAFFPGLIILFILGVLNIMRIMEKALLGRKINFLVYVMLFPPLTSLLGYYRIQDKSTQTGAYEYGLKILENSPRRSLILTFSDNDIYILWYLQKSLGFRPDVTVLGANFIHSGWYASYFENQPPDHPRITIRRSGSIPSKGDFYLDLMMDIINPNIDRFPILTTFTDPILEEIYRVEKAAKLYDESFYRKTPLVYLPHPYLYRISRKTKGEAPNG